MMKNIILLLVFMNTSLTLFAAGPQTGLRVDISGLAKAINIQITSAYDAKYTTKASWLKEKSTQYSYMIFPFSSEWKKVNFSFVTNTDGDVTMIFQGGTAPSEENKDTVWLYVKDISVTQKDDKKLIPDMSDTLWHFTASGDKKYKGELLKAENTFKVAYLAGVSRVIPVKGGEETIISVWYKSTK